VKKMRGMKFAKQFPLALLLSGSADQKLPSSFAPVRMTKPCQDEALSG